MVRVKFRRGGRATRWPWWQMEIRVWRRCITICVSGLWPKDGNVK